MKKMFPPWTFAALALVLVAPASRPAHAQQSNRTHQLLQHLDPDAMSAADGADVQNRRHELAEAAKIYGYNIEEGNWSYEQTLCAPMPDTILLHYVQKFPDGTESLFTADVPRAPGRIRIVPVLYRNATPFVPAPKNPRNYALFNNLVPQATATRDTTANGNWLELSACYAELTGSSTNLPPDTKAGIGIAGAPPAIIHLDAQDKTARVTFADRQSMSTYKVWSVSFNQQGRVTAAGTEDYSVYAAKAAPQMQPAAPPEMQPAQVKEQSPNVVQPSQSAGQAASQPEGTAAETKGSAEVKEQAATSAPSTPPPAISASTNEPPSEPGWKFIPHPPEPPAKIMPTSPLPPEKIMPEPSSPMDQPAPTDQPPQ
jgi:hypothetical protein